MPTNSQKLNLKFNGYELSFKRSGSGFPIILIHTWHPYAKHLLGSLPQDTHQVITFDTPGYYNKVSGKLVTNLSDLTLLLSDLFDHLGFEKVDLIGQCLGAVIVLNFAARYPERVRNLVAVTPPLLCYKPNVNKGLKIIFSFLERNGIAQFLVSRLLIRRQTLWEISSFFGGYRDLANLFAQESNLVNQTDFNPQVLFSILSSVFKLNFWDMVREVEARTLFVSGKNDTIAQNKDLEKLTKTMKRSSYEIIPSARHAVVVRNTKEFNKLVLNFLSSA